MSGIVGIVNLDGAPVDRSLLQALTDLDGRGADAKAVKTYGQVGFGHALLRTTYESEREQQPSTLDGEVWITADARIDGRDDLVRELAAAGHRDLGTVADLKTETDDRLLLHTYRAWGERCAEHLLGDFAFAIWDGNRQRLFCARDQLGVNPFFYAIVGSCLIFASELDCVRGHPGVSDDLNDLAIADFLLWGQNQELDTTSFDNIRRLPPAHTLAWSGGRPKLKRYWELSVPDETRYARSDDYVERFKELLQVAVADRLRTDRVGVLMSGGIDSPLVAAAAKRELAATSGASDPLRAHTLLWESVMPSDERPFAALAASSLDIPIDYHRTDRHPLLADFGRSPEPAPDPTQRLSVDLMRAVASYSRVALTGYDGDALCKRWLPSHWRGLLEAAALKRSAAEVAWYSVVQRSLPPIGLRTRLRQRMNRKRSARGFPPWLKPELVATLDLQQRWHRVSAPRPAGRPVHADALELLTGPAFPTLFDSCDPAFTQVPVAIRHPLLDLRVVGYLLSLPPVPWCVDKTILRRSARGSLPTAICRRPKTPLAQDLAVATLRNTDGVRVEELHTSDALRRFVVPEALPKLHAAAGLGLMWPLLWTLSLSKWLQGPG